jgi:acetyl esterase/lipase
LYQRAIARSGFLVVAIDFRQGPDFRHPAASADVVAAVRWLRLHAADLGADITSIGLLGSSSGGHLAMFAGVLPDAPFHRGTPIACDGNFVIRDDIPGHVDWLVALWPVSDPYARYRYARRAGIERLITAHERFYSDDAAMRAASVPRVVTAGEATHLPPLLVIMPGDDGNVPMDITFDLLRAWQSRHGYVEYVHFPEEPHGFGYKPSAASTRMQDIIINFGRRMVAG